MVKLKGGKNKDPKKIITETVPVFFFIWNVKERKIAYVTPKFYEFAKDRVSLKYEKDLKSYIDASCHQQYTRFFESLSPKNNYTNKTDLKTSKRLQEMRWIEIKTFPVEEPGEAVKLVVGHIVDATDRKEQMSSLEGENRNFDTIMQLISHDLRQPFTKISLLADLVKMEQNENQKINYYIDKIKDASFKAHELLMSFLQLTVLNYSQGLLSTTNEKLGSLIRKAVETFDVEIAQKNLTLDLDLPEKELIYPVDASLFKQLVKNIISNSIKFTAPDGNVTVKLMRNKHAYKVSITDTGIGIPDHVKANLFKDVNSVQRTGLEGQQSTGLGLIIANKIAELHHGKIDVESEEGKGTTFTIIFPLAPNHDEKKVSIVA